MAALPESVEPTVAANARLALDRMLALPQTPTTVD